jgi:hypothetical protein
MGNIVASASSAYRSAYEWWQSLEPSGLAVAFVVVVFFVFAALWLTCRAWSPVFWKRTDYAYFFFVIIGGAAGAADLAVNSLNKELAQIQMNMLTNNMLLRDNVSSALSICDKQRQQAEKQAQFGPDVIKPPDVINPKDVQSEKSYGVDKLSARDCEAVARISFTIQGAHRLKTAVEYGIDTNISEIAKYWVSERDLMLKIAASIIPIVDAQAREDAIKKKLRAPSYAYSSALKSLWPILLGLGIGIRLTRTRYDVNAEKQKEKEKARKQKSGS